jgi:hypothetical protein
MGADSTENDARTVWQDQPTERSTMTLERIKEKARELRARTRKHLLGSFGVVLAIAALCGFGTKQFPSLAPLFAIPVAWSMVGLYFLNRGMWSATMPGDAALSTGLEFCRDEIERRRRLLRRLLLWSLAPVLTAIGAFVVALALAVRDKSELSKALPFVTLVLVWIAGYCVLRMREQRQLQHEVDELQAIGKENGRG